MQQDVALGGEAGRGVSHTWLVLQIRDTRKSTHLRVERTYSTVLFTVLKHRDQSFTAVRAKYPTPREIL